MDILPTILVFASTLVLLAIAIPIAKLVGWVDKPGGRKSHGHRTPLVGGLCVAAVVMPFLAVTQPGFAGLFAYIAGSMLILTAGAWDDHRTLPVAVRFGLQATAALLMVAAGITVETFGFLPGGSEVRLGIFAVPFTVFAAVGLMNAFNMLDGLDGLLGSVVLAVLGVIMLAVWHAGAVPLMPFVALLAAGVVAFLIYNFPFPGRRRAAVFLGDAGSMWLGFTCAWLIISLAGGGTEHALLRPFTALWILALPVMDALTTMVRRKRNGQSPFEADRSHLHYHLQRLGLSTRQTVVGMTLLCALLGLSGIALDRFGVSDLGLALLFAVLFLGYVNVLRSPLEHSRESAGVAPTRWDEAVRWALRVHPIRSVVSGVAALSSRGFLSRIWRLNGRGGKLRQRSPFSDTSRNRS